MLLFTISKRRKRSPLGRKDGGGVCGYFHEAGRLRTRDQVVLIVRLVAALVLITQQDRHPFVPGHGLVVVAGRLGEHVDVRELLFVQHNEPFHPFGEREAAPFSSP